MSRLPTFTALTTALVLSGCASPHHARQVDLALYDSHEKPLATVALLLPWDISTNWCEGQWRGEVSAEYVRPMGSEVLVSDKLQADSWRPLRCRLDPARRPAIWIVLHPDQRNDLVELFIPAKDQDSPSVWNHVTDAGQAERGNIKVLHK